MKINLGAGSKRYDDHVNVDIDAGSNPDYVVNIETEPLPFEDNSVDGVMAHHVFEHLGDGFFHCIRELYRVCKHGAIIDVRVPHPRHDTFLIDPTHKRPIFPDTLDMFSKARNNRDRANGGGETPIGFINDVDMYVVECVPVLDPYWYSQFQGKSNAECEHMARTFNNVISEFHIKWVVNKEESVTRI